MFGGESPKAVLLHVIEDVHFEGNGDVCPKSALQCIMMYYDILSHVK